VASPLIVQACLDRYGGFGVIKLVEDEVTGSMYALKGINKERMLESPQAVAGVLHDVRMAALVAHDPHVLHLIGMYHDEGALYMLREVAVGGTLKQARTCCHQRTCRHQRTCCQQRTCRHQRR
jgi:serine/threonine protein kinase